MSKIAVNVAVLQDNKILLTQRDDFETWILPGGGVEEGESVAQSFNLRNYPEGIDRKGLYDLRDKSELQPQQFYRNLTAQVEKSEKVEVGNV